MSNYGKTSELTLKTNVRNDKTIISDLMFTAPFKILPPFYEGDLMEITILTVSAGLMDGDRQKIRLDIGSGSQVNITSQTFEKIHKMKFDQAKRETHVNVSSNAILVYKPLPVIPYADSRFDNKTIINLADSSSRFIYSEILTCGRVYHGERFEFDWFKNYMEIRQEGTLVYRDNTLYVPEEMPLEDFGFFEGFTHLGNLIFCNLEEPDHYVETFRDILSKNKLEFGVTKTYHDLIVVKILGNSSDRILDVFNQLIHTVNINCCKM